MGSAGYSNPLLPKKASHATARLFFFAFSSSALLFQLTILVGYPLMADPPLARLHRRGQQASVQATP
jgi:hypothetical protein